MKLKITFITAFITALSIVANTTNLTTEIPVNVQKSKVKWKGEKIGKVHWGYIDIQSGTLSISNDKLKSGKINIDMTTIVNKDVESEEWNQKLVDHLKSDDFFGVDTYKNAKFNSTEIKDLGNGQYKVTGDLTIKGKTHPNTFEVKLNEVNGVYKVTGTIIFDRSKYDVRYGSESFFDNLGDAAIDNMIELTFELTTK